MSVEAIAWALRAAEAGLVPSPTAAHVLIVLAHHADKWGEVRWLPNKRLGMMAMRSERQVRRALRELEQAGLIKRHEATALDGARLPNVYELYTCSKEAE